ncbi:unnamed protein product, partial [Ectocarpus sp. 13 AM-2016]
MEGRVDDAFVMSEYLSHLTVSGVPAITIRLKKGVVVMLCRNMSILERLTNDTKVVVLDIKPHVLQVQTLHDHGTMHWLPRVGFNFVTWQGVAAKRVHFPLRLCFTVTVNRAQGQTLDRTCLDLMLDPFAHGHLYVGQKIILTTEYR